MPVNTESAGTVEESETLSLATLLVSTDTDSATDELVYTLGALPADGALRLDGETLAVGDTFTQADVDDGRLSYRHDGAENPDDAFDWELSDGTNRIPATGSAPFVITITPVNDDPTIVNNQMTSVAEGATSVLTDEVLEVADAEDSSPLTYTFLTITRGALQKRVGAGPFVTLAPDETFTQEDIADGNLQFVDSGIDDAMLQMQMNTEASFSWRAADPDGGVNPSPTGSNATSFTVTPVDDDPVIAWRPSRCYAANVQNPANPVTSLTDPDTAISDYSICVVALGGGTSIIFSTGQTIGTTITSIPPTLRSGASIMGIGSCVAANALGSLTLQSTANQYGGNVVWRLMRDATQFGADATVEFVMGSPPC